MQLISGYSANAVILSVKRYVVEVVQVAEYAEMSELSHSGEHGETYVGVLTLQIGIESTEPIPENVL